MERCRHRFELIAVQSSKTPKPYVAVKTELSWTALRAACRGTLPTLIEAFALQSLQYRSSRKC